MKAETKDDSIREHGVIDPDFGRDVLESDIPRDVLDVLLKDMTTGRNIMWMTDNYLHLESTFDVKMGPNDEIDADVISRPGNKIIRPRVDKSKEEQRKRVVGKAEVFTPSWICNAMNNLMDAAWFGLEKSPFTIEGHKSWKANKERIPFPGESGDWQTFVREVRLEITCGEAPFLVSRYDTTTGEVIDIPERIGILDRKLRVVTENVGVNDSKKWLEWAIAALKGVLGFEWQGDNLFIARENILYTILEYYKYYCHAVIDHNTLLELARIVSWNIWQMDGLKFVIPNSCHTIKLEQNPQYRQGDLFEGTPDAPRPKRQQMPLEVPCPGCAKKHILDGAEFHNGIYCKIMDWQTGEPHEFVWHYLHRDRECVAKESRERQ
ncbi:MAG: restriction endonuclease subunit M [Kiritimatiellae bacterium]|nr:restriction endonuclease subunit M [Kiritimatiellia bacterium]